MALIVTTTRDEFTEKVLKNEGNTGKNSWKRNVDIIGHN